MLVSSTILIQGCTLLRAHLFRDFFGDVEKLRSKPRNFSWDLSFDWSVIKHKGMSL
jgi:hypothetical protein